jgi:hypothetical protein
MALAFGAVLIIVSLLLGLEIGYRQALREIRKGFVHGYHTKEDE